MVTLLLQGDEEDLKKDDEKPDSGVKAEDFVEDDEGQVADDEGSVGVDAVVFRPREMQGSVALNSLQYSFLAKST